MRRSIGGPLLTQLRPSSPLSSSTSATSSILAQPPHDGATTPGSDTGHKSLARGAGVSVSIQLAEPMLFLNGGDGQTATSGNTALLRGTLLLNVTKPAKIKTITLRFQGRARTKWPEGIPPRKVDFEEVLNIMSHTWPFFNAHFPNAEQGPGADNYELFNPSTVTHSPLTPHAAVRARDTRRLSLQLNQSQSVGKEESPTNGSSVALKGYCMFQPGNYFYNFELPIDSRLPETINMDLGSVKYELEAIIERAGAFKANLVGVQEVPLIRVPVEGSLEQVEPIAISRNWEDQLHYEVIISGKSFPLGAQVPIAFKMTPLAKVQCHRIRVLLTENTEYFCNNKRVHRIEPARKVQLLEKRSDAVLVSTFPGSTMRVTAGGGVPYDSRASAASGVQVSTSDPCNLLGDLTGESGIGPTEMEFNVQLPSCHTGDPASNLHFDTTYGNIQVHHWIKIVLRLSKPDAVDPKKRRHFEISIDSPFHILSCRATQANTSLPAYSAPDIAQQDMSVADCGCPDAVRRHHSPSNMQYSTDGAGRPSLDDFRPRAESVELARPPVAHVHTNGAARPIHMMRAPSFNPPAFEDEEPPPPLITPPPQYESIASPTSGLADYFTRLSDAHDDEDTSYDDTSRSRVEIPLTPGARVNRSMDVGRTRLPLGDFA